jgi:hypothetical protein
MSATLASLQKSASSISRAHDANFIDTPPGMREAMIKAGPPEQ